GSVRRKGESKLGTRVELKNINSFRFVRQAIEYEIARQVELIEGGGRVAQETRLFDNEKGVTRPMRSKEEANDYRYFPEPDLPPLLVSRELLDSVTVPKLPQEVVEMLGAAGVPAADARTIVSDPRLVEVHRRIGVDAKRAALFVVGELARAVIARHPTEVDKYKGGKASLLGFFVGQAMKDLKGKGNPGALNGLFKKKLGEADGTQKAK